SPGFAKLSKAVERGERPRVAVGQQQLEPGDPVRSLPMNQVPDDVVRAPGVRPLIGADPRIGQTSQPGTEHLWCGLQHRQRLAECEGHKTPSADGRASKGICSKLALP